MGSEKISTDDYLKHLMGYARSPYRNYEPYLKKFADLDENDIQLNLKQNNSYFIIYEITPGINTIKDISEAVYTEGDHEVTLRIDYDDISMKTKIILTHFGLTFGMLRFDEKSFF